jgi:uncharacterized protein (TIGR01777 family)
MRVAVTGATGFIGRALVAALIARGDSVLVFTRDRERARAQFGDKIECAQWDAEATDVGEWLAQLKGCDGIVHLAGESINAQRWTESFKKRLRSSRIQSTRLLVEAIEKMAEADRPKVLICSSGADYYGDTGDREMTEQDRNGSTFLSKLCVDWEAEALHARSLGVRVVLARTSIVLGESGGALGQMLTAFKLYMGGPIAGGEQYFPWMHLDDMVAALMAAMDDPRYDGPVNMVTGSVRMREFSAALGKVLSRPSWLPVPKFALKVALGEMGTVIAESKRIAPAVLRSNGFEFRYPQLPSALQAALGTQAT